MTHGGQKADWGRPLLERVPVVSRARWQPPACGEAVAGSDPLLTPCPRLGTPARVGLSLYLEEDRTPTGQTGV